MYNSLINEAKITVLILMISVFFSGCSVNKVKVNIDTKESETENEIISVQIPQIKGMSEEFCQSINSGLNNDINERINNFTEEAQNTIKERDAKAQLTVTQEVKFNKKDLLSVVSESFEYTSGLTGAVSRNCINIDTKTETKLKLGDLFNDEEYIQLLNARLEKISEDEKYSDIWEKPVIGEAQEEYFYLSDDGLVIFYPPYELSYYARGFVEFTVPYSELYGYLKPEYSDLY